MSDPTPDAIAERKAKHAAAAGRLGVRIDELMKELRSYEEQALLEGKDAWRALDVIAALMEPRPDRAAAEWAADQLLLLDDLGAEEYLATIAALQYFPKPPREPRRRRRS